MEIVEREERVERVTRVGRFVEMIQHNNIVILLSTNISYLFETIYA